MDLCLSSKLVYITCILGIIGTINIVRGIYYKSQHIWVITKPLVICIVRNSVVSYILSSVEGNFPKKMHADWRIEILFTLVYILVIRVICAIRSGACKEWQIRQSIFSGVVMFTLMYGLTSILDRYEIVYAYACIVPISFIFFIILVMAAGESDITDLEQFDSDMLEEGNLRKEMITALNKVYNRFYKIAVVKDLKKKSHSVVVAESSLNVYVIIDEECSKKYTEFELIYAAVHHTIEYYLGFTDTINLLTKGSYFILYMSYTLVILGYASDLSICLRFLICCEVHDVAMQIKEAVAGWIARRIEKRITKIMQENAPFSMQITKNNLSIFTAIATLHEVNKKLNTEYEKTFYKYYSAERIRDLNIKPVHSDV